MRSKHTIDYTLYIQYIYKYIDQVSKATRTPKAAESFRRFCFSFFTNRFRVLAFPSFIFRALKLAIMSEARLSKWEKNTNNFTLYTDDDVLVICLFENPYNEFCHYHRPIALPLFASLTAPALFFRVNLVKFNRGKSMLPCQAMLQEEFENISFFICSLSFDLNKIEMHDDGIETKTDPIPLIAKTVQM